MVLSGLVLVVLASSVCAIAETTSITGAGASFPAPIYTKWSYKYEKMTGLKLNYQSIGSGGGIAQIKSGTVDFGASDAPMKEKDLNEFKLVQFPMVIGGVVPIVNLPGVKPGELKLTGEVLADIYLGKITKWNDDAIKALNPKHELPDKTIIVVRRSDGSGTTWLFTNYLSKVSKEWKEKIGCDKSVDWPKQTIGGKGNEGVAKNVQQLKGAIGYVEYAYALQNKMTYTELKNKEGKFVAPSIKTFQAAAANADWKNSVGYYVVLTQQPGKESWPITGASFILIHKEQKDAEKAKTMLKFFDWCFKHGAKMAEELDYVPIPNNVVELIEKTWKDDVSFDGKAIW
jgi:phosphate transport system substrate-binding protein